MKSGTCFLHHNAAGYYDRNTGDLIYGGNGILGSTCNNPEGKDNNSINIGLQTLRKSNEITRCRNSISIGVDSGSTMGSSSEDSCGPGYLSGTGNISIGTRSGQYQHNPSIAIGYGVGSNQDYPQEQYSISIQNTGMNSIISKGSLGLGAYNVPDLSENSIYLGTGVNRQYQIHKNAIVLSTLNKDQESQYPGLSLKQMGKDNNGFFVDAIRVNPTKHVPTDAIPLVYSPKTGEIYAKHN